MTDRSDWQARGQREQGPRSISDVRLLLVDGDSTYCRRLALELRVRASFSVDEATSAGIALGKLDGAPYNILASNVKLPDMDGRELCRRVRIRQPAMPILLLGANPSEDDVVLSFEAGASDFQAAPFTIAVFAARVRCLVHQFEYSLFAQFVIGQKVFRPIHRRIVSATSDSYIALSQTECAILSYLCRNRGRPINRTELLREALGFRVEGNARSVSHGIETHIYRLRRKLEVNPSHPRYLITVPRGYMLLPEHDALEYHDQSPFQRQMAVV